MTDRNVIDGYLAQGYASPVPVMSEAEARNLVTQLELAEKRLGAQVFAKLNLKCHLLFPFLWNVVQDPRIVDVVEQVLGPDILCWGSSFFSKEAGSSAAVPWHQDGTCWGLDQSKGLTVWLALTPSTPETGCLRVIPGSHKGAVPHAVLNAPSSMLPLGEEIAIDVDEAAAVYCTLRPGQMSLHHVMLIHGSAPNLGGRERRIGFAIRYIAGDVSQRGATQGYATLVRGRDHGTYCPEVKPEADLDPQALRRHRDILRHSAGLVMQEAARLS